MIQSVGLRWTDTKLTDLDYNHDATTNRILIETLIRKPRQLIKADVQGRMLNGVGYSHRLYSYSQFQFTFLPSEGNLTTLRQFFVGNFKYLVYFNRDGLEYSHEGTKWIEIMIPDSELLLSYIEDIIDLRELTINAIAKQPNILTDFTTAALWR